MRTSAIAIPAIEYAKNSLTFLIALPSEVEILRGNRYGVSFQNNNDSGSTTSHSPHPRPAQKARGECRFLYYTPHTQRFLLPRFYPPSSQQLLTGWK